MNLAKIDWKKSKISIIGFVISLTSVILGVGSFWFLSPSLSNIITCVSIYVFTPIGFIISIIAIKLKSYRFLSIIGLLILTIYFITAIISYYKYYKDPAVDKTYIEINKDKFKIIQNVKTTKIQKPSVDDTMDDFWDFNIFLDKNNSVSIRANSVEIILRYSDEGQNRILWETNDYERWMSGMALSNDSSIIYFIDGQWVFRKPNGAIYLYNLKSRDKIGKIYLNEKELNFIIDHFRSDKK